MYETPEGLGFFLGAELQQNNIDRKGEGLSGIDTDNAVFGGRSRLGWVLSAGADFNITEKLLFTAHLAYSEGLVSRIGGSGPDLWGQRTVFVEPDGTHVTRLRVVQSKGWGGFVGGRYRPTHTIDFNARFGIADPADRAKTSGAVQWNHIYESHFNVLWRPVSQMRLGWEIMYGRKTNGKNFIKGYNFGTGNKNDPHNISGGGQCEGERANAFCRKRKEDAVRAQFAAWFFF